MIKNCFKIICLMAFINIGCSAQKTSTQNTLQDNIKSVGSQAPIEDEELQKLQSENDLVIAYAVENFAWARSIDYKIIAQKNNEWKGYRYHKNLMANDVASPTTFNAVPVNKSACDELLSYITEKNAWTIKGDNGSNFCTNGAKQCNINDAPGARLWLITKDAVVNPSYYAPEFYERCCHDEQRSLFLSITQKIATIVGNKNAEQ